MEAIASGTPIVGSAHLSCDVLADGENGLVVDIDPEGIAAAFRALLHDDALWTRLSEGSDRMIKRFDAVRVAGQYLKLALPSTARSARADVARDVARHDKAGRLN